MKMRFLAAISLVTAFWSLSAAATSHSVVCNGCTSIQTRQLVQGSPTGDYFVYDMLNRKITHYGITGFDIDHQIITNVTITPAVQTQFNWVQQLFDVTGTLDIEIPYSNSTATKVASVNTLHASAMYSPPSVVVKTATPLGAPASAFDLINTPANQAAAIAAMQSQHPWGNASLVIQTALASFTSHFTVAQAIYPVPTIITVTFTFSDASTSQITWNVNANRWDYVPGSSRDAVGNPIPENPDQAVGGAANRQNYVFPNTPDGVSAALSQSQNFSNIGLPVGEPVFRSGSNWGVACVRVGGPTADTASVSCTATPL